MQAPDDVRQIRALYGTGESAKNLARCYGVSDTNVRYIVRGRIWRSVRIQGAKSGAESGTTAFMAPRLNDSR